MLKYVILITWILNVPEWCFDLNLVRRPSVYIELNDYALEARTDINPLTPI